MKISAKILAVAFLGVCLSFVTVQVLRSGTIIVDSKTDELCGTSSPAASSGGRRISVGFDNRWIMWVSCSGKL